MDKEPTTKENVEKNLMAKIKENIETNDSLTDEEKQKLTQTLENLKESKSNNLEEKEKKIESVEIAKKEENVEENSTDEKNKSTEKLEKVEVAKELSSSKPKVLEPVQNKENVSVHNKDYNEDLLNNTTNYSTKSPLLSIALIVIIFAVGIYAIRNELIKGNKTKPIEEETVFLDTYANIIKNKIIEENKYFETTKVDNDWLNLNNLNPLKCKEIYYDNGKVLLHQCESNKGYISFYDKTYEKETTEYLNIYNEIKNKKFEDEPGKLLSEIVTEDEKTKIDACVNSTCKEGTPLLIKVSPDKTYRFYVVKDDIDEVTLILDHNLRDEVLWAESDNLNGPLKLIDDIKKSTDSWTNIGRRYYKFQYKKDKNVVNFVRAGIPSKYDIKDQKFYKENLEKTKGYWLMEASGRRSFNAIAMTKKGLESVDITTSNYGYRPIIKINR